MAKLSETDNEARKQLLDYIDEMSNKQADYPRITAQIRRMTEKDRLTIKGIHYTLWYVINIEQLPFRSDTLGIVPYFYDKAQKYYAKTQELKKQILEATAKQNETADVKITPKEREVFD